MGRVAIFVDAGYFWVQLCQSVLGRTGQRTEIIVDYPALRSELLDVVATQAGSAELLRVYWYDGPGQIGKGPDHAAIEELDDFKLRLGIRNSEGKQKAVDGLIIADLINLTQSKAIDQAILLSGDGDLTPGVTAAQAMGLRLSLGIMEPARSTSPYLKAEADRKFPLDSGWARRIARAVGGNGPTTGEHPAATIAAALRVPQPPTHELPLAEIAREAHKRLSAGPEGASLFGTYQTTDRLPPEVDKVLLLVGKTRAGRDLSEKEKRELRLVFKSSRS